MLGLLGLSTNKLTYELKKSIISLIIFLFSKYLADDISNNNFEIYEKKQTRDSLMDKINNEINNLNNKNLNNSNNNNYSIQSNEKTLNNENSHNSDDNAFNTNKNLAICDPNCKCESCVIKPISDTNNFQNCHAVSFKNPEQIDILVEHDKKQACCVIYNNNCIIY